MLLVSLAQPTFADPLRNSVIRFFAPTSFGLDLVSLSFSLHRFPRSYSLLSISRFFLPSSVGHCSVVPFANDVNSDVWAIVYHSWFENEYGCGPTPYYRMLLSDNLYWNGTGGWPYLVNDSPSDPKFLI
jgi:hypothetical protein